MALHHPSPPPVADAPSRRRQKTRLQARHVTRGGIPLGAAWLQRLICAASNEDEFLRAAREVPAALKSRKAPVQPAAQMRRGQEAAKSPNPGWPKTPEDYLRLHIKLPFLPGVRAAQLSS